MAPQEHLGLQMLIVTTGPTQNLDTVCALRNDQSRFVQRIRAKHRAGASTQVTFELANSSSCLETQRRLPSSEHLFPNPSPPYHGSFYLHYVSSPTGQRTLGGWQLTEGPTQQQLLRMFAKLSCIQQKTLQ